MPHFSRTCASRSQVLLPVKLPQLYNYKLHQTVLATLLVRLRQNLKCLPGYRRGFSAAARAAGKLANLHCSSCGWRGMRARGVRHTQASIKFSLIRRVNQIILGTFARYLVRRLSSFSVRSLSGSFETRAAGSPAGRGEGVLCSAGQILRLWCCWQQQQ